MPHLIQLAESEITAICLSNNHAYAGYSNSHLHMFDGSSSTQQPSHRLSGHTDVINCIVYCSELDKVISGSQDNTARVWNASTVECVHVLQGHTDGVSCAAVQGTM